MRITVIPADRSMASGHPTNLGDAMLTDALVRRLEGLGHTVRVIDFGAGERHSDTPRYRVRGIAATMRVIRSSDGVLMGGGTLFQHETRGPLRNGLPRLCFVMSSLARVAGTPFAFFGVGCDPVKDAISVGLLRLAVWRRAVWVRDEDSLARVTNTLHRKAHLGADLSLLLYGSFTQPSQTSEVLVSLNGNEARQLQAHSARAIARFGRPVFVNMHQRESDLDSAEIPHALRDEFEILQGPFEWQQLESRFAGARAVVASRMHALYYAALTNRPMIAVGSSAKVAAFAREFNVPLASHVDLVTQVQPACADPLALQRATRRLDESVHTVLSALQSRSRAAKADTSPRPFETARRG